MISNKSFFLNISYPGKVFCMIIGITTLLITGNSLLSNMQLDVQAQASNSLSGIFNHTQTNMLGNTSWINSGNWTVSNINSTSPSFEAIIEMSKPNGSALHEHEIKDFNLTSTPIVEGDLINFNGTSTITMKNGPVMNTPTIIALSNESLDVYFDPNKIDNHFENQSLSGVQK